MGVYLSISIYQYQYEYLRMADMIPVVEVTLMMLSFPQES